MPHIDEQGFVSFTPIGGWDPRLLPGHMLTIAGQERKAVVGVIGTHPPHIQKPADREKVIPVEEMFLVMHYPLRRIGKDTVMGRVLDDRAGCAAVIKALEGLAGSEVEATVVADVPGVAAKRCASIQGKGPAITVADGNFVVPQRMVQALIGVAEAEGIPYQFKLPPSGGTDAGAIHQSRGGVLTGIVSVPCRYIHSPFSTCRIGDFDHTWRLLAAFCKAAPGVRRNQ